MRILVTGGAGFIGSHLVEKLLALGHGVAILDDFNDFYDPRIKHGNIAAVKNDAPVFQIDLRDNNAVRGLLHREKFDAIVHLAARAGVRPSIAQPQLYYDANVNGTLHLLDAARTAEIERFIFASSSSVYGICRNGSIFRGFSSYPNHQSVCRHQNCRRIPLLHVFAPLPDAQ